MCLPRTICAETSTFPTSAKGWCMSWLGDGVGWTDSAQLCWSTCEAKHGDALVAIDWWPADTGARGCWCKNDCMCMDDGEVYVGEWGCDPCMEDTTGAVTIIRNDVELPPPCERDGITAPPLAQMCMDPATFMPDKALHYQCHSSNSEDPAVEADCPEDCESHSWLDEVDGAMKYGCHCEVSSAEECADKYPGEQAAEHRCNGADGWENHSPSNQL